MKVASNNPRNVLAVLNANMITDERQRTAMQTMGMSACQVACIGYKCCTGHGRGGKHIQYS